MKFKRVSNTDTRKFVGSLGRHKSGCEDGCDEHYWRVRHRRRGVLTHARGVQEYTSRRLPMAVTAEPSRSSQHELWLLVSAVYCSCASVLHCKGHRATQSDGHVIKWVTRQPKDCQCV